MAAISKSGNRSSGDALASRFSLAAKLYSIFALIALLTAAIAILSDYNTRRNAELTEAIETANRGAFNVERVNSLVYAVVMESRGVYMSTDPAVVKKYGAPKVPAGSAASRPGRGRVVPMPCRPSHASAESRSRTRNVMP